MTTLPRVNCTEWPSLHPLASSALGLAALVPLAALRLLPALDLIYAIGLLLVLGLLTALGLLASRQRARRLRQRARVVELAVDGDQVATGQRDQVGREGGQVELEIWEEADVEHLQAVAALDVRRADVPQLGGAMRVQAKLHAPRP